MPKTSKPRKPYRPKGVNYPITQGLIDDMGKDMHFALLGMKHGDNSPTNWKRIGKVLFIVSIASDDADTDKADKVAIDSAVLVLKAISDRQVRVGVWGATEREIETLSRGVVAAERTLPRLDYRKLAEIYSALANLERSL